MFGPPVDDSRPEGPADVSSDLEGLSIEILYRDMRGQPSVRTIRCHGLRRHDGALYIDADCALRRAPRTFRLDRIVEIRDYSTGEIIEDVAGFFACFIEDDLALPRYPEVRSPASPRRRHAASSLVLPQSRNPRASAAFRDGARVLLFFARSGGELYEEDRALILDYAVDRIVRMPFPPADPEAIAGLWINNQVPTRASATASLGRVTARDEDAREIAGRIFDILLADGRATDAEMASAWALVRLLENLERARPGNPGR